MPEFLYRQLRPDHGLNPQTRRGVGGFITKRRVMASRVLGGSMG